MLVEVYVCAHCHQDIHPNGINIKLQKSKIDNNLTITLEDDGGKIIANEFLIDLTYLKEAIEILSWDEK